MKKKLKLFDSDSLKILHKRVFFSVTIFIFVYFISIYRISDVMLFSKDLYSNIHNNNNNINLRGDIYDRNGAILATSINSLSISINPQNIKNKKILSKQLSKILFIDENIIERKLNLDKKFVWLKRNITPNQYQKIVNLGEINIKTHKENRRIYPFKEIPSHVVGYVNIDQNGQSGIERYFDEDLSNSKNIILSLDINLQQIIRKNLIETINHYRAESGLAVVMDISNGNILSSVSYPDYNPENKNTYLEKNLLNRVIQSNFEMGSTFKPITATIGYDLNIIEPEMTFDVKNKFKGIGDHDKFKDNGVYNIEKIIVESSNIGTAQIATLIGKENQINFFNKIGFDNRINIEIKEAAKPLGNKNNWGSIETATIGFGHGYSVTPLHLLKAYGTLSNQGVEVEPTFLLNKKNNNKKNKIFNKFDSSSFFLNLLRSVITKTEYTGPRVNIDGYEIGGKTGTAELLNPEGGYYKDRNLTSFIGVFPTSKPKYVIYTAINYPKKEKGTNQRMTGARVNAPLAKKIITNLIKLYNIPRINKDNLLKVDTNYLYNNINEII